MVYLIAVISDVSFIWVNSSVDYKGLHMKLQELIEASKPYLMDGAFWVSPQEQFHDAGRDLHIGMVIKQPNLFGMTRQTIDQTYERYGEKVNQEGDAREEIMVNLMRQGWIRIRKYRNHYSVQAYAPTNRVNDAIESGVNHLVNNGVGGKYASINDDVKVSYTGSGSPKTLSAGDILSGGLHS